MAESEGPEPEAWRDETIESLRLLLELLETSPEIPAPRWITVWAHTASPLDPTQVFVAAAKFGTSVVLDQATGVHKTQTRIGKQVVYYLDQPKTVVQKTGEVVVPNPLVGDE